MDTHVQKSRGKIGIRKAGFGQLNSGEGDSARLHKIHRDRIRREKFGGRVAGFNRIAARILESYARHFVAVIRDCRLLVNHFLCRGLVLRLHHRGRLRRDLACGLRDGNLVIGAYGFRLVFGAADGYGANDQQRSED